MSGKAQQPHASGFTLIEMMLASAILAIILLGMQSAMLLASRAGPNRTTGTTAAIKASQAMDQLSSDLAYATSMTTMTANTIQFTVPDRNGDAQPETIRYSWTGTSGDPLLRTLNNGSAVNIASNVAEFQLNYDKRSQQRSPTSTESGEILLNSYDGVGLLNLGDGKIDNNSWYGQYFKPSLPAAATQWRITRIKIRAQQHGTIDGTSRVLICTAKGGLPGVIVDEASMAESTLAFAYSWQEFTFLKASGFGPAAGACFVLRCDTSSNAADLQYQNLLATAVNANLVITTNSGATWSAPAGQDLLYYAYGTYSTVDPVAYDYWLTDVRCTLRKGSDPSSRLKTTIRLLNPPQVSGP